MYRRIDECRDAPPSNVSLDYVEVWVLIEDWIGDEASGGNPLRRSQSPNLHCRRSIPPRYDCDSSLIAPHRCR